MDTPYETNKFLEPGAMIPLQPGAIDVQTIYADWLSFNGITLDVLRLDKIHPVISGNKWFKLKYHIDEAKSQPGRILATFGGAWSNHIAATAYACKLEGIRSVGIIRGEKAANLSATLEEAEYNGMELIYVGREEYRNKKAIMEMYREWYWVNEGGFGVTGSKGAEEILSLVKKPGTYSHIIAALGTGTMLAGLINAAAKHQHVIGISSMKGNVQLEKDITTLTPSAQASFEVNHDYHFGGYGKHPRHVIDFINSVYHQHQLPLDIVYTSKVFYAIRELVQKKFFPPGSKLLMIHSGGLQGNRSLPAQVLAF